MTDSSKKSLRIGEICTVEIEKAAHGGHFIARHEGAVIFIRHAIPGEIVEVEITEAEKSFFRAEIKAVIEASGHRVQAPCQYAHPGGCGGCDFQHIDYAHQRQLKSEVIAEQFARIAKMEVNVEVEEVSSPLHWRSRFAATTNHQGDFGFKETRSNKVIPISHCPVLIPEIDFQSIAKESISPNSRVEVALSTRGERTIAISPVRSNRLEKNPPVEIIEGKTALHYEVMTSSETLKYQVSQGSFWQSNINAPATLVNAVRAYAQVREGDHILDLYGGVGLFAKALVGEVGSTGRIDLVEASTTATRDAQQNFRDYSNVSVHRGDVARVISQFESADIVLLDPPRTGAGQSILSSIADMAPRSIVYIACDPAALARDTGYLRDCGYHLQSIRAFDLFPMTHHIESIAHYTADTVSS
jgi:tRNA/tmRNA/rRNA uracil-C5-methylase (TrmA/RlmC/RlmD family)